MGTSWQRMLNPFLQDRLLHLLVLLGAVLALWHPLPAALLWDSLHGPTLATLSALMVLTRGIEASGAFDHLGRHILNRLTHERSLALFLVAAAALLSTVITNDIALFIMVPLTLRLRTLAGLPIARLIIFEALAVNAGSLLTPIGNPQNILLWQVSQRSFWDFTLMMAPLAALLNTLLLAWTAWVFPQQRIRVHLPETPSDWTPPLFFTTVLLYPLAMACVEWGHPLWGLLLASLVLGRIRRGLLFEVDWSLIAVFALMFVDIRLLTGLPLLRQWLDTLPHASPLQVFLSATLASQGLSNVPATMLLVPWVPAGPLLAFAVNVGGFGTAIGSLANLIALRMAKDRRIWLQFHYFSLPFLAISVFVAGHVLLGVF